MTVKSGTLLIIVICCTLSGAEAKRISDEYWLRADKVQELILTVTPSNHDVGTEAGSVAFSISSNTGWEITDDADWLTISPVSGNGDGTITASYTSNDQPVQRVGNITITGNWG